MRIYLIISFLAILTTAYSKDSCEVSYSVSYTKADSEYWKDFVTIVNDNKKVWFLDKKKKLTLPQGKYTFTLYSEFGDGFDTIITLNKEKMNVELKITWSYIFQQYSNSLLQTAGDTIIIDYEKKFCSGGSCVRDRDKIELYKTKTGQYSAHYFTKIITGENCLDVTENSWSDKLLNNEKTSDIQNYFFSNYVPHDKDKVTECVVKMGRRIFFMNYDTYLEFRKKLLS